MDYVTPTELQALLGPSADSERVALAVDAANAAIGRWIGYDPDDIPEVPTATSRQAGRMLAHTMYREHAAVGGVFGIDDLIARLPADHVKAIRDYLDADTVRFGVG